MLLKHCSSMELSWVALRTLRDFFALNLWLLIFKIFVHYILYMCILLTGLYDVASKNFIVVGTVHMTIEHS